MTMLIESNPSCVGGKKGDKKISHYGNKWNKALTVFFRAPCLWTDLMDARFGNIFFNGIFILVVKFCSHAGSLFNQSLLSKKLRQYILYLYYLTTILHTHLFGLKYSFIKIYFYHIYPLEYDCLVCWCPRAFFGNLKHAM